MYVEQTPSHMHNLGYIANRQCSQVDSRSRARTNSAKKGCNRIPPSNRRLKIVKESKTRIKNMKLDRRCSSNPVHTPGGFVRVTGSKSQADTECLDG